MPNWYCKKHKTFGDNGYSCAICGYPLGERNIEFVDGKLKILKFVINLFFFKLFIFKTIQL
jgi:hypothetical protein